MKNYIVVGTAGHVDHGKTTLVKALTGIDTDRLVEEKKRGITIELGFAFFALPSGLRAGVVDVPGHERFIKNMLAGVSGIDLVVLVIAADEGVMPQTKEHLDILQLLGVEKGIIALTKTDMVEEDWLLLVEEEVRTAVKGTFLENAPLVPVSAVTGQGLGQLKATIDDLATKVAPREQSGYFRLPIDRVFTMTGFGTVVTGTLLSGKLEVGQNIEILPAGLASRVRHLQVHGQSVNEALAGQRVAVNLAGLEVSELNRGDVLAQPDIWRPTQYLDVKLHLLASSPKSLANRERIRFHLGTKEVMGRVILLDEQELQPGSFGFAQIRLENSVIASPQDLFVLRSYSPMTTIGGGTILDPYPPQHKRFREEILQRLEVKEKGSLEELLEQALESEAFSFFTLDQLAEKLQTEKNLAQEGMAKILAQGKANKVNDLFIHRQYLEKIRQELANLLTNFHRQFPLKAGYAKELARKKLPGKLSLKNYNALLELFKAEGWLTGAGENLKLADHQVVFSSEQQAIKEKIERLYLELAFNPPSKTEVFSVVTKVAGEDKVKQVYEALLDLGILVAITPDLVFHREIIEKGAHILREKVQDQFTVADFRDWVGSSRKYALPLLEYYDQKALTQRQGDKRRLR